MTSGLLATNSSATTSNLLINQAATGSGSAAAKSGTSADAAATLNYNFKEFLTLFTTQLKNQDPTNPMDTTQMTNQLAMFSQVEQQAGTNTRLDKLISTQPTSGLNSAVSYIGHSVEATGNSISLSGGSAEIAYEMPQSVSSVRIDILNSSGSLINTLTGDGSTGVHRLAWDGTDKSGGTQADGTYTVSVTATTNGSDSAAIVPVARTTGKVTGVESNGTSTVLNLGNQQVNISDVLAIRS